MSLFKRFFGHEKKIKVDKPPLAIRPSSFLQEDYAGHFFQDLSGSEAAQKVAAEEVQVLDVRYEYEYKKHHIPGATLIPLPQLYERHAELDPERPTLVVCEHGLRSLNACSFLSSRGFKKLYNMLGGMSVFPGQQEGTGVG